MGTGTYFDGDRYRWSVPVVPGGEMHIPHNRNVLETIRAYLLILPADATGGAHPITPFSVAENSVTK